MEREANALATEDAAQWDAGFEDVFRRAPDVMCVVRVSDALMYAVNDAFVAVSGYTREQMVGRSSRDFPWWPTAEERERILGMLRDQGQLDGVETRFSGPGGETIWSISASPITFRGERCAVWRATDVTKERHAEQANRKLEERLRQKESLERLGMLAGAIAHDFNNLLVGVLGHADVLLSTASPDSPMISSLRAIVTSAQRMAEHTRELLDYAGHTAANLRPLQLDVLLEEIVALARSAIAASVDVGLRRSWDGPLWIRGDRGQLTRMFVNLIKNAAEALEERSGSVTVWLDRVGNDVEVRVCDNGRGMDEATRARMFDPFFSTKLEGRGLGLSSVPMIVERHAGTVSVSSEAKRGTTITVRFPAEESPTHGVELAPPQPKGGIRGRVLVVDDDPGVRSVAAGMLVLLGYEASEADGGLAALELLKREPDRFALVLLDATMPGLSGKQTLERLRVIQPDIPVLLCSGYSVSDFTQLVTNQPHTAFLTKPFRVDQLGHAVSALLDEARPASQARP